MLANQNILLGVTGGIAAYRSAELVRLLLEDGAQVRVVMTENATQFVSELTFQALSGNPVRQDLFDEEAEAGMGHIELARWADVVIVAPASANFVAKLVHGIADDLLSTICLATEAPLAIAPAMNRIMWENSITQANIESAGRHGISVFGPGYGSQACGEKGAGRMLLPSEIVDHLHHITSDSESSIQLEEIIKFDESTSYPLQDTKILITAGATWEAIDPVRGVTNRSSGKMGFAIVNAARRAGAKVTLISGVLVGSTQKPLADETIEVTTALEMRDAVLRRIDHHEIFISVAAVADYRPVMASPEKIKKQKDTLNLTLIRNPDILSEAKQAAPAVYAVGFAAESSNVVTEGKRKLLAKGVDLIAANSVSPEDSAIGSDTNKVDLIDRSGTITLGPAPKTVVASRLITEIAERYHEKNQLQNSR